MKNWKPHVKLISAIIPRNKIIQTVSTMKLGKCRANGDKIQRIIKIQRKRKRTKKKQQQKRIVCITFGIKYRIKCRMKFKRFEVCCFVSALRWIYCLWFRELGLKQTNLKLKISRNCINSSGCIFTTEFILRTFQLPKCYSTSTFYTTFNTTYVPIPFVLI